MTDDHKKRLLHFLARPAMYIFPVDKNNIVSFVTGYEIGSDDACDFTSILNDHIGVKHGIARNSTGWPGQIQQYSEAQGVDWVEGFKKLAHEIL